MGLIYWHGWGLFSYEKSTNMNDRLGGVRSCISLPRRWLARSCLASGYISSLCRNTPSLSGTRSEWDLITLFLPRTTWKHSEWTGPPQVTSLFILSESLTKVLHWIIVCWSSRPPPVSSTGRLDPIRCQAQYLLKFFCLLSKLFTVPRYTWQ